MRPLRPPIPQPVGLPSNASSNSVVQGTVLMTATASVSGVASVKGQRPAPEPPEFEGDYDAALERFLTIDGPAMQWFMDRLWDDDDDGYVCLGFGVEQARVRREAVQRVADGSSHARAGSEQQRYPGRAKPERVPRRLGRSRPPLGSAVVPRVGPDAPPRFGLRPSSA